jgi:2-keto-4-pentenoate hydratase
VETDDTRTRRAFRTLWEAHESGYTIAAIPEEVRPRTRAEGYAVQAHFAEHTAAVVGWKIAATSEVGQRHINVSGPLAGRVLAERLVEPGEPIPLEGNFMHLAELEFAFRMATDFAPRDTAYSQQEVVEGTGDLLLSWEIPSTRYDVVQDAGEAQLVADNACGFHLSVVPAADQGWKDADLAAHRVRATNSSGLVLDGAGHRVLGDPRTALTWLVNELSGLHITVEAGQVVTTGICTDPMPVAPGDTVTGDFGRFGTHSVTFR